MLEWLGRLLAAANLVDAADNLVNRRYEMMPPVRPNGTPEPLAVQQARWRRRCSEYMTGINGLVIFVVTLVGVALIPAGQRAGIPLEVTLGTAVVAGAIAIWVMRRAIRRTAERFTRRDVNALRARPSA